MGKKGLALLILASLMMLGMGTGEKKISNAGEQPTFSRLEDDQEHFIGTLKTEDSLTSLQDLSFSGTTKLTGLRKEKDKSFNDVDLFVVSKIEVEDGDYRSPGHNQALEESLFIKAKITFTSGVSEEYLLPHKLELSGIDARTGVEKTWRLRTIQELEVKEKLQNQDSVAKVEEVKPHSEPEEPGFMGRVAQKVKKVGRYITSALP